MALNENFLSSYFTYTVTCNVREERASIYHWKAGYCSPGVNGESSAYFRGKKVGQAYAELLRT